MKNKIEIDEETIQNSESIVVLKTAPNDVLDKLIKKGVIVCITYDEFGKYKIIDLINKPTDSTQKIEYLLLPKYKKELNKFIYNELVKINSFEIDFQITEIKDRIELANFDVSSEKKFLNLKLMELVDKTGGFESQVSKNESYFLYGYREILNYFENKKVSKEIIEGANDSYSVIVKNLEILKFLRESIAQLDTQQPNSLIGSEINSKPHHDKLNDWIYPDSLDSFIKIENELLEKKYLDKNYKWVKSKRRLIDFILVIQHFKLFKPIVNGKKGKAFHYRQFISELYGDDKLCLSETAKKYKPSIDSAKIPFLWVESHLIN